MRAVRRSSLLTLIAVCTLVFASSSSSKILLQTGFEKDEIGKMPQQPPNTWESIGVPGFEVDSSNVKEGKQSLKILGGADLRIIIVKQKAQQCCAFSK